MDFSVLLEEIKQADTITIFRHVSPDCDAVGSQFALKNWIEENFSEKHVYACGNEVTHQAEWPENDKVSDEIIASSIAIVLDTANKQRVDDERFAQALKVIKVDHHPDREPFGDICLINDSAAATCEILTFFFDTCKEYDLSQKTAEYLYRGLLTDSLNYTTNNTTQETLKAGGILASTGLDLSKISHDVFDNSIRGFKFTGYIISHTEVVDNAFAYVIIDEETYTSFGLDASEARSFVGKLSNVKDFSVYAVFTTKKDASGSTLYDGSLRSKKNRINDIAEKFGGGGHACAAGVKNLTQENMTNILNLLRKRI